MKSLPVIFAFGMALPFVSAAADFDAAGATNQVGLDLYRQLAAQQRDGNLVISPYSIESALGLAYVGADGETRTQMAGVLRFPADDASVQTGAAALRTALEEAARKSKTVADQRRRSGGRADIIEWREANRLFGQEGYAFRTPFLTLMKDGFAAPFEAMDFEGAPEPARAKINSWVEEQTKQKIRDLIPSGALQKNTRLVLVNTLYLKGPWERPFEKTATRPRPFRGPAGEVSTMHDTSSLGYAKEPGLTAVTLDYLGGGLQFLILLPDEGQTVGEVAKKITAADFLRWAELSAKSNQSVSLYLPKFRVEGGSISLGDALGSLGMKSAFDKPPGSANFDRIAPRRPDAYLAISDVFHKTFIALDEEGTEAAAATAVVMAEITGFTPQPTPIEVRVDRPFLFAIQHRASGTCLFLGRIADPR